MRTLAFLAAAAMLSGCLASDQPQPDDVGDGGPDGESSNGQVRASVELGRLQVDTPVPGLHTFTVDVPKGGATDVRWQLTITGPSTTSTVNGNGCTGGANLNLVIQVGGTSTRGGSCSALGAGPAEFTVSLTDPALGFTAAIFGTITTQSS